MHSGRSSHHHGPGKGMCQKMATPRVKDKHLLYLLQQCIEHIHNYIKHLLSIYILEWDSTIRMSFIKQWNCASRITKKTSTTGILNEHDITLIMVSNCHIWQFQIIQIIVMGNLIQNKHKCFMHNCLMLKLITCRFVIKCGHSSSWCFICNFYIPK